MEQSTYNHDILVKLEYPVTCLTAHPKGNAAALATLDPILLFYYYFDFFNK